MSASDLLFSFKGRVNRAKWWLTELALLAFTTVLSFVGFVLPELSGVVAFVMLLFFPLIWVKFAIGIKRLYDRDKSGGWVVIFYVLPVILMAIADHVGNLSLFFGLPGLALYIWSIVELGVLRGTIGPNQHGPEPLQQASAATA